MFRPRSNTNSLSRAIALVMVLGGTQVVAQDRTADWLEAQGLDGLLSLHLEQAMAEARGNQDERRILAERLAEVYAQQLEHERSPERRRVIVESAERLLATGDAEEADRLRLALLRARYVSASMILENDRAALGTDLDLEGARREVSQVARELSLLQKDLARRMLRTDQLLDRATGLRARSYQKSLKMMRETTVAAALLQGWSLYYDGRAKGTREVLREAEVAFGRVLQGDEPIPGPTDVSLDRQQFEFFASAVLGMGLVSAAIDDYAAADAWFTRLESPRTWRGIREALPGWRLAAAIDADDPEAALQVLRAIRNSNAVEASWFRVAAVGGLRMGTSGSFGWKKLATTALAALAQRGELAQVVNLAEQFGVDAMGKDGFAFRYVRGVRLYRDAVKVRNNATGSRNARMLFEHAATELLAAVEEDDAGAFEGAVAASLALAGWSLIETEAYMDAARVFSEAAELGGTGRADAEWGAIVALDHLVAEGGSSADRARNERNVLIEGFIDRFPADERLPSLVVRRIAGNDAPTLSDIETLRAVPREHTSWELARRRAAQALYRRFRGAKAGTRGIDGHAFLDVANELLTRDTATDSMFADINGLDGLLLRQAIEVATNPEVADLEGAAKWIVVLEFAAERGAFGDQLGMWNELAYRRLALAIAAGDLTRAEALLGVMPAEPEAAGAKRWTELAAWRLHRIAASHLRNAAPTADVAKAVIGSGEFLLASKETLADAVKDERMLVVAASVASARHALFLAAGDRDQGMRALELYEAVLQERRRDGSILQAAAELARGLTLNERSLAYWRRISNGANRGDERWWAARTNIVEILEATDPDHASKVLDQHKQLYPEFGPAPWGRRIRDVAERLAVARESGA